MKCTMPEGAESEVFVNFDAPSWSRHGDATESLKDTNMYPEYADYDGSEMSEMVVLSRDSSSEDQIIGGDVRRSFWP